MIDEEVFRSQLDRQTKKALAIGNDLFDMGFPTAISGGCARRMAGWCEWMNDVDMLTSASPNVTAETFMKHGLKVLVTDQHHVAGYDRDGLYEITIWHDHGDDTSIFGHHPYQWRFEHRSLAIDVRTQQIIPQKGGIPQNLPYVKARMNPAALHAHESYRCYTALAYACREDIPFDEDLLILMRDQPVIDFFDGLLFKLFSKVLVGRNPARGMDRLLEANMMARTPALARMWRNADANLRSSINAPHTSWIVPWIILLREDPRVRQDLLTMYFPEKWLTYYESKEIDMFPSLDTGTRDHSGWGYWHTRQLMMDLIETPPDIAASSRITDRPTPFPFP